MVKIRQMRRTGMRGTTVGLAAACLLLAALPASARPAASSSEDRLRLGYEVYMGGLHVLDFSLGVALDGVRYDVTADWQTAGALAWVISWRQTAVSAGEILHDRLRPERHRNRGEFRGRSRSIDIDYANGRIAAVRTEPTPQEDDDRDEVTEAERRDAIDPISAILQMALRFDGTGCDERLRVFDGRRRYDIIVAGGERVALDRPDLPAQWGVRCEFVFEPIAGYERRRADPEARDRRLRSGRVWIAHLRPGAPPFPVRLELNGDWGRTVAHLRSIGGDRP